MWCWACSPEELLHIRVEAVPAEEGVENVKRAGVTVVDDNVFVIGETLLVGKPPAWLEGAGGRDGDRISSDDEDLLTGDDVDWPAQGSEGNVTAKGDAGVYVGDNKYGSWPLDWWFDFVNLESWTVDGIEIDVSGLTAVTAV